MLPQIENGCSNRTRRLDNPGRGYGCISGKHRRLLLDAHMRLEAIEKNGRWHVVGGGWVEKRYIVDSKQ